MSLYKKYIAPYYTICLLLLLGLVLLEGGHYWLHYLEVDHHGGEHDHTHTIEHHHEQGHAHTVEDHHHGHDHIKDLFVVVTPPIFLKSHQAYVMTPTAKDFTKLGLFFLLRQTLYTFQLPFYQANSISVTLLPTPPPPQI